MARILVVEDEAVLRKNIVDRLRADGHEVIDAGSGEMGVELARLLNPHVVLTDLRLPGMDGLGVLRQVRRISPPTLVVLMSAYNTAASLDEARRDGALVCVDKPIELRELSTLAARAVRHFQQLDDAAYERRRHARSAPAVSGREFSFRRGTPQPDPQV
ncbi:MAG: response regulator [Phycisphaerae bacterium]